MVDYESSIVILKIIMIIFIITIITISTKRTEIRHCSDRCSKVTHNSSKTKKVSRLVRKCRAKL
jgi:hypothetical protein